MNVDNWREILQMIEYLATWQLDLSMYMNV
jgi:hypothetical protein